MSFSWGADTAEYVRVAGRSTRMTQGSKVVLADSGDREVEDSGFTREPDHDKPDLSWIFTIRGIEMVPREMIERIATHFANGAAKYEADNWRRGTSPTALARYRRSLARHVFAWFRDETDEDHAAAIAWNAFIYEINLARANEGRTGERDG